MSTEPPHSAPVEKQRRGLRRKLLLALLSVPVWCIAVEAGYRGVCRLRGEPYDAALVRADLAKSAAPFRVPLAGQGDAVEDSNAMHHILHPYLGWTDRQTLRAIEADTPYFLGSECESNFDVLILGGSVAYGFAIDGKDPFVAELERARHSGARPVRVFGYGKISYKQPQQVMMLTWLFAMGFRPDAVVEIDGFNEVTQSISNADAQVQPTVPSAHAWSALARGAEADREGLELLLAVRAAQEDEYAFARSALRRNVDVSAVLGRLTLRHLSSMRRASIEAQAHYAEYMQRQLLGDMIRGPHFSKETDDLDASIVRCWSESSLALQGLCAQHGIAYVHVLQPTLFDEGAKVATKLESDSAEGSQSWVKGVQRIYPRLRAAGYELERRGVHFADASQIFRAEKDDRFIDACHLNPDGYRMLAELAARALGAELDESARAKR